MRLLPSLPTSLVICKNDCLFLLHPTNQPTNQPTKHVFFFHCLYPPFSCPHPALLKEWLSSSPDKPINLKQEPLKILLVNGEEKRGIAKQHIRPLCLFVFSISVWQLTDNMYWVQGSLMRHLGLNNYVAFGIEDLGSVLPH